jgi:hypothetical protein
MKYLYKKAVSACVTHRFICSLIHGLAAQLTNPTLIRHLFICPIYSLASFPSCVLSRPITHPFTRPFTYPVRISCIIRGLNAVVISYRSIQLASSNLWWDIPASPGVDTLYVEIELTVKVRYKSFEDIYIGKNAAIMKLLLWSTLCQCGQYCRCFGGTCCLYVQGRSYRRCMININNWPSW